MKLQAHDGKTRSLFPLTRDGNTSLIECDLPPGTQAEFLDHQAMTLPLDAQQTCGACKAPFTANPLSREFGSTDQCDRCTAQGLQENEHSDHGHEAEDAGDGCPECKPLSDYGFHGATPASGPESPARDAFDVLRPLLDGGGTPHQVEEARSLVRELVDVIVGPESQGTIERAKRHAARLLVSSPLMEVQEALDRACASCFVRLEDAHLFLMASPHADEVRTKNPGASYQKLAQVALRWEIEEEFDDDLELVAANTRLRHHVQGESAPLTLEFPEQSVSASWRRALQLMVEDGLDADDAWQEA